ncbi:MAG: DUF502 domain-containing protein [Chloroflexi bacterium]|nr:DUF502 domain-containing protein [Chloroflexota bacterium]
MLAGLLLLFPIVITYALLRLVFNTIDGLLQPLIKEASGWQVPGLGVLVLIVLIYLVGLVGANFLGRRMFDLGRATLLRIPVIGTVYSSAKQLIDALFGTGPSNIRQVVMIEYPRKDTWTIGFLTASIYDTEGNPLSVVYIPTAPTPQSGWIAIVPERDVHYTDLSVAAAMRLVLSGGIIAPPIIRIGHTP